ncbi:eukaryotic integral membrane protein [Moniliophthora roreri MCA 2997]|uniref:Eukaryotic integral membrane protein n=1 Tax=Moniliophthora roreri (strain MCA 2997) TaxID=1381753 RepID=V2XGA4_MONRO|nr:eukaryotic integral membrane protein [Moniliophthora roreri MCA 2997]
MAVLQSPITFIASIPPATRYFTFATIFTSLLYTWMRWKETDISQFLALVSGSSIFYPWTFVTSALLETSILGFIVSLIVIPPSLRYLERLWGSVEILKFIAVTVGASNVIVFAFSWLEFLATSNADFLYSMRYNGQMSLQMGVLVAFTQLIPEHQVQVLGVIKARVKTLPMAYLAISTVMTIIGFQCPWIILQFAWFVSWIYLRFYKKNTNDTVGGMDTYGDRSETFSLVSWFPPFLHPALSVLANFVFSWAVKFHLIPSHGGDLENGGYSPLPGSARAEAERRRAMALKALDQRMANSLPSGASASTSSTPQTPRPPPPVVSPRAEASNNQKNTAHESELGDIGIAKADDR